jgi:chloramphenicol O-acetyltransferase
MSERMAGAFLPRIPTFVTSPGMLNRNMIPVSVHVNHAVADGLHVGEFFGHFEKLMKEE